MRGEFAVGQRWVSQTDSSLGLGLVVAVESRRVQLSFPAVEEERTYAVDRAPLTRLRFRVGDEISVEDCEGALEVTAVDEHGGLLRYRARDASGLERDVPEQHLAAFLRLETPRQRLLSGHGDDIASFELRVDTLKAIDRLQRSAARGLLGTRTALLHHQLHVASEVAGRDIPRVMLADEVGLGKTIEAGMILHQQLVTGRAERALIIVPEALLHQWLVELLRRFNLRFALFDRERLSQHPEQNPFEQEQCVLCALELFQEDPVASAEVAAADWDLLVVDEAHHLHWDSEGPGDDYRLVAAIAERCRGVLLLTATPEHIGVESHFARLQLLDPARFHSLEAFLEEEARYSHWSDMVEALERGEAPAELPPDIARASTPEARIAQLLDRYGTGRSLFRNSRLAVPGFPGRRLHRYPLDPPQLETAQQPLEAILLPELAVSDTGDWAESDPRVAWLRDLLRELRRERVLIICALARTAVDLEHHLHLRAGIRCAAFHEGLSIIERDRAAAWFADQEGGAQCLVCSEIGSEGRNFQFARHLVLFDLPLNPDLLEQRIGRLDRIGQEREVQIHVPYRRGSAQEFLLDWYEKGLAIFRESCSAGQDLLEAFRPRLVRQLQRRDDDAAPLLEDTRRLTEALRRELREGRDRLLERHSCRRDSAQRLIDEIQALEDGHALRAYLEQLCDVRGVELEDGGDDILILRPGDADQGEGLPMLAEEGMSATLDRDLALAREDLEFLSWEHPLLGTSMEQLLNGETGNAAVATLSLRGVEPGTVLLEVVAGMHCMAPRKLQLHRFLPLSPQRLLLADGGRELSELLPRERLAPLLAPVPRSVAAAVARRAQPVIDERLGLATTLLEGRGRHLITDAMTALETNLGGELQRLEALAEINPGVRPEEIESLRQRLVQSRELLQRAQLQIEALRLLVVS